MWIFSRAGMFSVVEAAEPLLELGPPGEVLAVRARVERDLDALRSLYAPELGPTVRLEGRDYPYRAYLSKGSFASVMVRVVLDLDYGSFKSMVAKVQGAPRAGLYAQVWSVMHDAERKLGVATSGDGPARTRDPRRGARRQRPAKA